jgi:hypothetical protein
MINISRIPECLRRNKYVQHYYEADALTQQFGNGALEEARNRAATHPDEAEYWHRVAAELSRREGLRG